MCVDGAPLVRASCVELQANDAEGAAAFVLMAGHFSVPVAEEWLPAHGSPHEDVPRRDGQRPSGRHVRFQEGIPTLVLAILGLKVDNLNSCDLHPVLTICVRE